MTKRNLFYFIQFCILTFGVSFPFWQTTEVFQIYHPLWVIIPAVLFTLLFSLSFGTIFSFKSILLRPFKKVVFYWLGGGFILFFTFLLMMFLNNFILAPEEWLLGSALALSSVFIAYSYYQGKRIYMNVLSFFSHKIRREYNFIQLSDLHIGSNGVLEIQRVLDKMRKFDYDFVVITGDLVDEDYASQKALALFDEIKKPIYYITGNHEYYLKEKHFTDFISQTNIIDINDQKIVFKGLDIFGIDERSDVAEVLDELEVDSDRYNIMLMHEPKTKEIKKAKNKKIDLILSGHTHNGQIFPLTLLIKIRYFFLKGLYALSETFVHVSQGTSTWGPKMRLGTRNEITLIKLIPKK